MQASYGLTDPWQTVSDAAETIIDRTGVEQHDVVVVLGSGWGHAADRIGAVHTEISTHEVRGFPHVTVPGHRDRIRSIHVDGGPWVLVLMGRVHAYEGHELHTVVHGVRAAIAAGCHAVVLTNAAGGVREGLRVGQPVLISDHLNMTGRSPLTGPNAPEALGYPRFVDMSSAYSSRLRAIARQVDPTLEEGVYAGMPGPQYETPAEVRMLRSLGADLVGMSTVHETIAARHAGAEVLGLSLVSNAAAGLGATDLHHEEVVAAAEASSEAMGDLLAQVVARL